MLRIRWTIVLLAVLASGCSLLRPPPEPEPAPPPPAPAPAPEPEPEPAPAPEPEPPPEPAPPPAPEPVPPEPYSHKVAVLLSSRVPAFENVAFALADTLADVEVYDLSDRSLSVRDAFDTVHRTEAAAVVAVGLRAALYARDYTQLPVVYAQVFNVSANDLARAHMRGVAALPPLAAQLAAWRELNPELSSVGAIVGPGHEALLAEAADAAGTHGLTFRQHEATSDREALYLFNRMAPEIDGYWLFPDNRILSATVLREMLAYAARQGIQVAVFNDGLLELGATLSTTADPADIAGTIAGLLRQIEAGELADVPRTTPLDEVRVTLHPRLERRQKLAESPGDGR